MLHQNVIHIKHGRNLNVVIPINSKLLLHDDKIIYYSFRSDVFAAMFSHDMKETLDNIVEIKDSEPHVLKIFLR